MSIGDMEGKIMRHRSITSDMAGREKRVKAQCNSPLNKREDTQKRGDMTI